MMCEKVSRKILMQITIIKITFIFVEDLLKLKFWSKIFFQGATHPKIPEENNTNPVELVQIFFFLIFLFFVSVGSIAYVIIVIVTIDGDKREKTVSKIIFQN